MIRELRLFSLTGEAEMKKKPRRSPGKRAVPGKSRARPRRAAAAVRAGARGRKPAGLSDRKRHYLERFASEVERTLRVLDAFPPGRDDFKPHERSGTAVRVAHTFIKENGAVVRAARGEWTLQPNLPPPPATVAQAREAYAGGARELMDAVREMPESRLDETVTFVTGPGTTGPVRIHDMLWFMLLDSVHHRGQLSVYVRMAGGKVPSIYGPSADEPWR
jgi:uncharacterized damage-inducible protein DinB